MSYKYLQRKKEYISGKIVIGIDPSKNSHQAMILGPDRMHIGNTFSFRHSFDGFHNKLWKNIGKYITESDYSKIVFAIEASTDVWQNLASFLTSYGHPVVLISPKITWSSRRLPDQSFSKTDPKDAMVIAQAACNGYYNHLKVNTALQEATKTLALTYYKLKKDMSQNRARIRSVVSRYFPEFIPILKPYTDTALYLIQHYLHASDYLDLDINKETPVILKISNQQHGTETLNLLKKAAQNTIGVQRKGPEVEADKIMLKAWINIHNTLREEHKNIENQLHALASQTEYFHILTSLKGISSTLAALFIAETVDLDRYTHDKPIQKLAGLDLQMAQSGNYMGRRRISHNGNRRLRHIIYLMVRETSRFVPEVRIKYLKRLIKKNGYNKNLIACSSPLLQLIMALVRDRRIYGLQSESVARVVQLQNEYDQSLKKNRRVA